MEDRTKRILRRLFISELSVKRLLTSVAFIYGSLASSPTSASDPHPLPSPTPRATRPAATGSWMIDAGDGARIAARWIERPGARYTILLSHGNAEDLGDLAPLLERLRALGANVLAYDYEGYGLSGGAPSEARLYADVDLAYRYLTEQRGVPPEDVIAYGRSLGAAAARRPRDARGRLAGLVLESAFTLGLPRRHARPDLPRRRIPEPRQDGSGEVPGAGDARAARPCCPARSRTARLCSPRRRGRRSTCGSTPTVTRT